MGVALVQSYGYARFVQSIPGAVAHPGAEFIGQTMLVLTGGAIVVAWLGEQLTTPRGDELPVTDDAEERDTLGKDVADDESRVPVLARSAPDALLLGPGAYQSVKIEKRLRSEVETRRRVPESSTDESTSREG